MSCTEQDHANHRTSPEAFAAGATSRTTRESGYGHRLEIGTCISCGETIARLMERHETITPPASIAGAVAEYLDATTD